MKLEADIDHIGGALKGLGRWLPRRTVAKAEGGRASVWVITASWRGRSAGAAAVPAAAAGRGAGRAALRTPFAQAGRGDRRAPLARARAPAPSCSRSAHGQRPGDSVGRRGRVARVRQHRGRATSRSGGSGQRARGPDRSRARPATRLGAVPGRARRDPLGALRSPPSRSRAPGAPTGGRAAAVPPAAGSRSSAGQLAVELDLEPGKGRGWMPTRVRLRVLAVGKRSQQRAAEGDRRPAPRPRARRAGGGDRVRAPGEGGALQGDPVRRPPRRRARRVSLLAQLPGLSPRQGVWVGGRTGRDPRTEPNRRRRYGTWVAEPPAGTYFTRGSLMARGRRDGAYRPRLLLASSGGARPIPSARHAGASRPSSGGPAAGRTA